MTTHAGENRSTRIVCTVGPASRSLDTLIEMIQAGLDVARLHFAYGGHQEHAENIERIREAADIVGRRVAILQDLPGTKVRMESFAKEQVALEAGTEFILTSRQLQGDTSGVRISIPELIEVVEPNDCVLLNDGAIELRALETSPTEIRCEVIRGGMVKSQQAVHVSGKSPNVSVPTAKDRHDARFGLQHRVDWIALSYATRAEEIHNLRQFIRSANADTPVVAKIERKKALENLDEILRVCDAAMVARGDLGLEMPIEAIGLIQKAIVRHANLAGKPVIAATEMLTSMMEQPKPTRAEVTDITNAVLDGADAVMLSGETAVGAHPVEAVRTAAHIAAITEAAVAAKTHSPDGHTGWDP